MRHASAANVQPYAGYCPIEMIHDHMISGQGKLAARVNGAPVTMTGAGGFGTISGDRMVIGGVKAIGDLCRKRTAALLEAASV